MKLQFNPSTRIARMVVGLAFALALVAGHSYSALAQCFKVGDPASVLWEGSWYPAKVQKVENNKYFVSYDNYSNEWDEWVSSDRIKQVSGYTYVGCWRVGDAVTVEWKGSWYPAKIKKVEGDRYFISYDGYGTEWDEWVTTARMKGR